MHMLQHAESPQRNLVPRLLAIESATWFGAYAAPVVLAFAVLNRGGSTGKVGLILAADTLGMLMIAPYGGAVADRVSRNVVMFVAEVAAALFQGIAVLVLVSGGPLIALAGLQALVGISRGFFYPAATGLVPTLIADARLRQRANGLLGVAQACARLGAPPLAGVVVASRGAELALGLNCGAYACSALLLIGLPRAAVTGSCGPALDAVRGGWRELRSREWLWLTVAWFSGLQCVAQAPLLVLGPGIAMHDLGGAAGWGFVVGGLGAGAAGGAAIAAFVRLPRPLSTAIATYLASVLPLLALARPLPLPFVVAAAVLAGGGAGFFGATWFTVFQLNVPRDAISRVSAWDWEASLAGLPLGMLLAPQLAHLVGAPLTLMAAAVATVVVTLLVARRTTVTEPRQPRLAVTT